MYFILLCPRKAKYISGADIYVITIQNVRIWIGVNTFVLTSLHMGHRHRAKFSNPFAAIASDIIATELIQHDNHKLAGVEATSVGEVIFALLGEILFLGALLPTFISVIGITLVISGIVLHSVISALIDRRKLVGEKQRIS